VQIAKRLPFFRQAYRLVNVLAQREHLPRSEIASLQLESINRVWQHAITYVPHYRQVSLKMNLPKEFKSLDEYTSTVPILQKTAVRESTILSERPSRGRWIYTGGSTGIPLAMFRDKRADLEMSSCQYRSRAIWGVDIFDRTAMLWGHGGPFGSGLSGAVAKLRRGIEDSLRNRVRFSAYRLGKQDLDQYLREMKEFAPVLLYGYSSALYLLALEALESRTSFDSLKLVVLTSELVTDDIRDTVQRAFRTNVVGEYGAAECQLIAYEDNQHLLRVREDLVMVETLPTQDNYYRIIISVLNNPSFPLLRYDIGDLADRPLDQPGTGFAILPPIIGRNNDFLISRSGRRVRVDAHIVEHHPSIKRFTAHQFSNGKVVLLLEVDSQARNFNVNNMRKKLSSLLDGQNVEVELTENIPPTAPGKHRWVISELSQSMVS